MKKLLAMLIMCGVLVAGMTTIVGCGEDTTKKTTTPPTPKKEEPKKEEPKKP